MGYCTVADVKAEFRSVDFTATSAVTQAAVDTFINQATAEIDSRLVSKFVTPITALPSLDILKQICVWLVADRVASILRVKSQSPDTGQNVRDGSPRKAALQMLTDIMTNQMQLPGAVLQSLTGGVKSFNASHGEQHLFNKNRDQW